MNDEFELDKKTEAFFKLHWGFESSFPVWDHSWNWKKSVPNYDKCGVYALL